VSSVPSVTGETLADALAAHAPADVALLSPDEHRRWLAHATQLVHNASWEGARGVSVNDTMRHMIAAHAALVAAGFEPSTHPFRNVAAIVVHTRTIVTRDHGPGSDGLYSDEPRYLAGQSGHHRDPLLLDWRTFRREVAAPHRGQNVVYHEFAHKLDQLTGSADGMPPLPDRAAEEVWLQTMGTNQRRLARRGSDGLLRAYGGTDLAEFFAVASEVFFTRPLELRARHPRVYAQLAGFYGQDPAARRAA
jgi:Mlc titration factor MtfA (ptsG expression regulator)